MILLVFSQTIVQTDIGDALALTNAEREIIQFTDFYQFNLIKCVFKQDQILHHTMIRHPDQTVIMDIIDLLVTTRNYSKVLIINKRLENHMVPDGRLKYNYYIIRTTPQLEECLNFQVEGFRRNRIIRNSLPLAVSLEQHMFFMMAPEPESEREPERTPLKRTWTERLDAMTSEERAKEKTQGSIECVICIDAYPAIMLAPCMHQCVCKECIVEIMERGDQKKKCPICREPIDDIFKPIK